MSIGRELTGFWGAHQGSTAAISARSVPLANAAQIVAGYAHTCGRATNGELYCWGRDQAGQLGLGWAYDNYGFDRPQRVRGLR